MGIHPAIPRADASDAQAVKRLFQNAVPLLLDGAPAAAGHGILLRSARQTLARGWSDPALLPAETLRETLGAVAARLPKSPAKAGLTAINAKHARIWWDASVLDNLDDVIARLDSPRAVLRFYDVTDLAPGSGRWNETFDLDISLTAHGHTAQFARGDREYVVDLGYVYADGRFLRLARTNPARLPRDGRGAADTGEVARCLLRPRNRGEDALPPPDARARAWAAARPDERGRDIEAELTLHMLYRAFLREGPRALRRAPGLVRRDTAVLEREFSQRVRARERAATAAVQTPAQKKTAPALLVARLDAVKQPAEAIVCRFPPAAVNRMAVSGEERFAWYRELLAAMRTRPVASAPARVQPRDAIARDEAEPDAGRAVLVREFPVGRDMTASLFAAPVFQAAKDLRDSLTGMRRLDAALVLNDSAEASGLLASATLGGRDRRVRHDGHEDAPERSFGGSEAKRMAKAGVRITRMALTLEGRMRPGARLKVAGKLVHADAEGKFRLECVLSGRKASIPMRAGVSVGGEARSLINVEWEKRAVRDKRRVEQD